MGCTICGKELSFNDIGATKKFINRGATTFYCKACIAKKLGMTEEFMEQKIAFFKRQGCTLFS